MTIRIWMTGALAGAALLTASASASAQDCATDSECGEGLSCVLYAGIDCPSASPCEDGFDCSDDDASNCIEEEYGQCEPVPVDCTGDSDCAGDFVCVSFTYESCDGTDAPAPLPAPEPGSDDDGSADEPDRGSDEDFEEGSEDEPEGMPGAPNNDDCEVVTEAYCVPPYVAPCDSDAACGAGFDCVEVEMCECGGGGSTGSAGGEVPPMPAEDPDEGSDDDGENDAPEAPDREDDEAFEPEVDCSCSGTGEFYCQPEEVSCESSADCTSGWSCEESGDTVCTFDVSTGEEFCEQSESYCFPPNWDVWGGAAGGGSNDDFGYPTLDRAVGEAVENIGEDANEPSAAGRRPIDEGCAAAAAPAAASWALMLLGLLGFRRRRR